MTTLGRVALRDFAMLRQGYVEDPDGVDIPDGWVGPGVSVFPSALRIMEKAHSIPTTEPYPPTGVLVPFTPEIATFTPGDEDVGSYANAFDQTITSRMASCTFSTDGMSYEDMKELCRCFGIPTNSPQLPMGYSATPGLFNERTAGISIPGEPSGITNNVTTRQRMGYTDGFQTWTFLWQDGLEKASSGLPAGDGSDIERQIYVMPLAFVSNVRIQAGIRREIGMTASAIAREVIEVANVRDWFPSSPTHELKDYYAKDYPKGIFTRASGPLDEGILSYESGTNGPIIAGVRKLKHRFISAGIEIYLQDDPSRIFSDASPDTMHLGERVDSDNVGMTIDLSTGLNPSWRFGDLAFRQGIRGRRGMMISLDFVNDSNGRRQFRRFLALRREVQKIFIVFYDPEYNHRMIIESYIRLVNVGQLPSDDGQLSDVFPLMYQSVGIKYNSAGEEVYLNDKESDFAIHFSEI